LVASIRAEGFRIEPIPGASAVAAAISASGVDSDGFTFLGFPPIRAKDRERWFRSLLLGLDSRAAVLFEAPHKLKRTLEELCLSVNRPIFVARELTKLHEELIWATPAELLRRFENPHGEFTIVIPQGSAAEAAKPTPSDEDIREFVGQITETERPKSKREAARLAGERLGLPAKRVYDALERAKIGR
jgi:16S rRNA (cytidine1402-2'-O)-methyltransferase